MIDENSEAALQGASVGTVTPDNDPSDDALLDSLGFGDEAAAPQSSTPSPESEPSPTAMDPDESYLPDEFSEYEEPSSDSSEDESEQDQSRPEPSLEDTLGQEAARFSDPKANHAFAALRKQNADLTRKLKELEASSSRDVASLPEVEELKSQYESQIQELQEKLGQYDLSTTPAFRQKYDSQLTGLLNKAGNLLKKAGASEEDAEAMLSVLRSKSTVERAEQLNEFLPALSGPVVNILEDFDDLLLRRETELRNWKESRKSIEEEERRLKKSKSLEIADSMANSVLQELESEKNPFFTRSESDSSWNRKVEERAKVYRGLLKNGDSSVLAKLIAEGIAAREFQKLFLSERKKRREVEQASSLSRQLKASPGNYSSSTQRAPASKAPMDDEELLTNLGF